MTAGIDEGVLLLRSDFDNYMLHVHPGWPFLDSDHLSWLFELFVKQSVDTEHHSLCLLYLVCAVGACYRQHLGPPTLPAHREIPGITHGSGAAVFTECHISFAVGKNAGIFAAGDLCISLTDALQPR